MLDVIGNLLLGLVVTVAGYTVLFGLVALAFKLWKGEPLVIDPQKHAGPPSSLLLGFYLVVIALTLGVVIATAFLDFTSRNEFGHPVVTYLDYARSWIVLLIVVTWSWFSWKGKKVRLG